MTRSPLILAGCALLALSLAGREGIGKLALAAGLPGPAARLIEDPAIRGVALYRAGDHAAADLAFRAAGRSATYNRGLSLAATGNYPLSRAYFDAVLFANPADSEARDNRAVVDALIPPVMGEGNEAGRIAVTPVTPPDGPPVEKFNVLGRPLDAGRRVADAAWLEALPDDPGEFLRLRLADEHLRRLSIGLTPPEEGDPW